MRFLMPFQQNEVYRKVSAGIVCEHKTESRSVTNSERIFTLLENLNCHQQQIFCANKIYVE